LIDVNTTGEPADPDAVNDPSTHNTAPPSAFTTDPAGTDNDTPTGTVKSLPFHGVEDEFALLITNGNPNPPGTVRSSTKIPDNANA
jgi:hypothetical protein